jgi:predicted  nucleic acid-binding Zn-ribbon protein
MAYERSPLTGKIDYASLRQRIDEIEGTEDDKRDALQQLAEEVERQGQALESLTKQVEALKPK